MEKQSNQLIRKNTKPQEQLEELITCQICYTIAKKIMMCPHCSKIYCEPCIKKSLVIKSQCPHCRNTIKDSKSMANCQRFVNEVKSIVEEVLKEKQKQNFRCDEHDVALNYFCIPCERSVCCECKMFGSHKDHQLVQVEKKYQEKYSKIRSMLADLRISLKEKQELIGKFENLLFQKQNHFKQQTTNTNNLQKSYEEQHMKQRKSRKQEEKQNTEKLESQLQKLNGMKKRLRSEYSRLKKECTYSFDDMQKNIIEKQASKMHQETEAIGQNFTEPSSNLKDLIPSYTYYRFTIENFSQRQSEQECIVYSDPVQILGCSWRLKVYPKGSESVEGKYLSIYVMILANPMTDSRTKQASENKNELNIYEYAIEISSISNQIDSSESLREKAADKYAKGPQSGKTLMREYSSTFEPGQSWGYIKFIELKELGAAGYLKDDALTVKYGIRKPNYFNSYTSLVAQLHSLQSQIAFAEQSALVELNSLPAAQSDTSPEQPFQQELTDSS